MAGSTSGISPSFLGLARSSGQVTHVLLTRSRLCPGPKPGSSLHLHVLSAPPAFVLSQDQTLREKPAWFIRHPRAAVHCLQESCQIGSGRRTYPCCRPQLDGLIHMPPPSPEGPTTVELGRDLAGLRRAPSKSHTLLSFQRPSALRGGDSAPRALSGHKEGLSREAQGV